MDRPEALILAGPNGAGKTTASRALVPEGVHFLNSDAVAARLLAEGHPAAGVEAAAGRIILRDLRTLVADAAPFCIETNLAGRGFIRHINDWGSHHYNVRLLFIALASPELAVARVAARVASGGHDVPPLVVTRRWSVGLGAFFDVYSPLVDRWRVYDNSERGLRLLAEKPAPTAPEEIIDEDSWARLRDSVR